MPAQIRWHGERVAANLEAALYQGLQKGAAFGRVKIIEAISHSARTGGGGRRRPGRGKNKGKPMQFNRSRPGQPPKRDTGKLAQSIMTSGDRQQLTVVIATKLKYGVSLEKGATIPARTPKRKKYMVWGHKSGWVFAKYARGFRLAPRPYFLSTLKRHKQEISAMVLGSGKTAMRGGVQVG